MMRPPLSQSVLDFNLFGEIGDLPDVVHCETIEARSVLHDWEFAPHRHARLHQVLLIESGGGVAAMEGDRLELAPMRAVNVPPGHVHGFTFTPGTQGWVLTCASEFLDEMLQSQEGLAPVLAIPALFDADETIRLLMRQIFSEYDGRAFARAQVLRSLTGSLLGLVARRLANLVAVPHEGAEHALLRAFERLLERHFLEHWGVADYASALAVTPTHLSRAARAATGKPASRFITDRIVREARRNLVYTNLPVSTIAYALGFDDPAYFSRVFAKATGYSPRAFRDIVNAAGKG